jgi:hypothetical protein
MKDKLNKYQQMDGIIFGTLLEAKQGSDKVDDKNQSIKDVVNTVQDEVIQERQ